MRRLSCHGAYRLIVAREVLMVTLWGPPRCPHPGPAFPQPPFPGRLLAPRDHADA